MNLQIEAMQQETAAQFGAIAVRNQFLAARVGALEQENQALKEELEKLTAKPAAKEAK